MIERVTLKVKDWKEKFLSAAGKEILLKAVIQSIPTYAMSCFLLPKGTCDKIEQKSREFWWGNVDTNGVNWLAWDKVKCGKKQGGIGFRDMENFNKALLAKQGWRLLTNQTSLVARIMKQKYYRNESIMDAKLGNSPSYAWRSIVVGLELLKKGLIKKVGNGGSTNIFSDPWIHRSGSFRVYSPSVPSADKLVCNYVIDGTWNINKLNTVLWPVDVYDISRLATPNVIDGAEDTWTWYYEDNGCYSVKSGYNLLMEHDRNSQVAARGSDTKDYKWMESVWKLKVQRKIQFLIWKIVRNIIPTRKNLIRRNIGSSNSCQRCGEEENSFHLFVQCSVAQRFWEQFLPLPDNGVQLKFSDRGDWLMYLFQATEKLHRSRLAVGMWCLWLSRNNDIFGEKFWSDQQILTRANRLLEDQLVTGGDTGPASTQATEAEVRNIAAAGTECMATLRFDGAWSYSRRSAGGGVVLYNQSDRLVYAKSAKILWGNRAKEVEAYSLLMGIQSAVDRGVRNINIEGDAEVLIDQISGKWNTQVEDRSYISDIVAQIRHKCSLFSNVLWRWIPRECNVEAHKLATLGLSLSEDVEWEYDFPSYIPSFLRRCSGSS